MTRLVSPSALVARYAAVCVLCLSLHACHRHKTQTAEQPTQTLEGVEMSQSTLGKPAWKLRARAATLENGDAVAVFEQPEVEFYKDRKQVSTVSAAAGVVETDTHDVTLSTDVVVRSLEDESVLKTSELVYSSQKQKFLTDKDVLVTRPGGTLHGRGLEASPDLTDIRVFNQRTTLDKTPE